MEQIQPYIQKGQVILADTVEVITPYVQVAVKQVSVAVQPLLPYYEQARGTVTKTVLEPVRPYLHQVVAQLAPVFFLVAQVQDMLPTFKGYPVNYIGIAAIVLHVLNYNITAQLEYHTRIFSKIFGKLAIYIYALFLIVSALIRDHYLMRAIERDAGSRILFSPETAENLSFWLITFGIFLNLWVLQVLGFKNMFNGDSFGYLLDKEITDGPYKYFDDPQYFGTTLALLGYAVKHQSRIGYGLTGVMYLAFSFSVMLIEGPHLKRIYAEREKKAPKNPKNKVKKNQ